MQREIINGIMWRGVVRVGGQFSCLHFRGRGIVLRQWDEWFWCTSIQSARCIQILFGLIFDRRLSELSYLTGGQMIGGTKVMIR